MLWTRRRFLLTVNEFLVTRIVINQRYAQQNRAPSNDCTQNEPSSSLSSFYPVCSLQPKTFPSRQADLLRDAKPARLPSQSRSFDGIRVTCWPNGGSTSAPAIISRSSISSHHYNSGKTRRAQIFAWSHPCHYSRARKRYRRTNSPPPTKPRKTEPVVNVPCCRLTRLASSCVQ